VNHDELDERKREIMKSIFGWAAVGVSAVGVMGIAGCAGYPVPNAKVASSEAAIRAAQETGSGKVPQAALHLKLAEEQLQSAKGLIRDNENKRAEYVLMRAQADAELAIALSHVAVSNVQAGTAVDEARAVRSGTPTP
jgi:pyridoxal biosynthesis lyase PdxS